LVKVQQLQHFGQLDVIWIKNGFRAGETPGSSLVGRYPVMEGIANSSQKLDPASFPFPQKVPKKGLTTGATRDMFPNRIND
jgi:hypothetical protein